MSFDTIIMVDWSGGNDRGASPKKDAIWTCIDGGDPQYHRNRQAAESYLIDALNIELKAGRRVLVGFDLCFAYPTGFARVLTGSDDPLALWDWFENQVQDTPKANNRFELAAEINRKFPGTGPFWFTPGKTSISDLPAKGNDRHGHGLPEKRETDRVAKGAFSPWQLGGAGAVGGQVIMGLPTLSRLRRHFGPALSVWPFEPATSRIILAETYFSMLPDALSHAPDAIKDAAQVRTYANAFARLSTDDWKTLLDVEPSDEGWVLGLGHEETLQVAAKAPPPLRNDCFAMPRGAHWTPVDQALSHIRTHLHPIAETQVLQVAKAGQHVLASDAVAIRSHPPHPNAAVDGYGFKGPVTPGPHRLPLQKGRAAAGQPFEGTVAEGAALRILTGANLPRGVDTVILQEDVTATNDDVAFHGPLKTGVNTRAAGEDMKKGDAILPKGRRLTPADLGTLTAAGIAELSVYQPLRVGVLSTGDELRDAKDGATPAQIFDANRPMLLDLLDRWGFETIDLGRARDDRPRLQDMLTKASKRCDAILTSGGASGGDEDHMSALLQGTGSFALWRMALKPGRPLALGLWKNTPVFALPGNPVAAFVCALIFARPALLQLAGSDWDEPVGFDVPAGFSKSKKAGRREYLRARWENGAVIPFASEGSGRVSGLSWATGLIELPDDACTISAGDPVKYLPFGSFGL